MHMPRGVYILGSTGGQIAVSLSTPSTGGDAGGKWAAEHPGNCMWELLT